MHLHQILDGQREDHSFCLAPQAEIFVDGAHNGDALVGRREDGDDLLFRLDSQGEEVLRRAVADAARAGQRLYFEGFHRVCVFSDNGPAARDGAFAAKALFEETYPDVKVYVDYEIPYFIVSAGNCLTKEEAIMLKGRVSATFPKAFLKQLKREKSPISNLLDQ